MQTKKFMSVIAGLSALTLLVACGDSGGDDSAADEPRITFSFGQSVHPFFIAMEKGAQDAADELGAELTTTSADYSVENQVANVEDSLQRQIDALLINPIDSEALANSVTQATNQGVPVISVDIDVVGAETTSFVSSDNEEIGRQAAAYIIEQLDGEGQVALIGAPQVTSTLQREQGFLEAIEEASGIELVANSGEAMERATALDAVETILQANPNVDAIFGVNESGALGALGAAQARGLDDLLILAVDATPDVLDSIQNDTQVRATVAQDPYQMGHQALEAAIAHLNGEEIETEVSAPIDLVTIDNVQEFIDREAEYAE